MPDPVHELPDGCISDWNAGYLIYFRQTIIHDLIKGFFLDNRFGFEECTYLLLFGVLPDEKELQNFKQVLNISYDLPHHFIQDVIMKSPTADIIANMTKSTLALGIISMVTKKESENGGYT